MRKLTKHCEETVDSDGIIKIHSDWWGMPHAILTGRGDSGIRPCITYKFVDGEGGEEVADHIFPASSFSRFSLQQNHLFLLTVLNLSIIYCFVFFVIITVVENDPEPHIVT
jgi:hypothetical protein